MKKLCTKSIMFLAVFSLIALPAKTGVAHETDGVAGNSYLTFFTIDQLFDIDIFTFGTDGTFIMERKDGNGNYEYHAPIFEAEWKSTDGTTTYNFTGLSLVSLVIIGWEDELSCSTHADESDCIFFVGIYNGIISD